MIENNNDSTTNISTQNKIIPTEFTEYQKSVLTGLMLGDGNISLSSTKKIRKDKPNNTYNGRLTVKRAVKDEDYLRLNYEVFKDFCIADPVIEHKFDIRTNKTYSGIYFYTRHLPIFTEVYNKWYGEKKFIPKDLVLDKTSIAIWFLDDGCVISSKNGYLDLKLATNGFTKEDVQFLADMLSKRYDANFRVAVDNEIAVADAGARRLLREIDSEIPECMSRKSDKWRKATDIFDLTIKEHKSNFTSDEDKTKFLEVIKSFNGADFTSTEFAKLTEMYKTNNPKKLDTNRSKKFLDKMVKNKLLKITNSDSRAYKGLTYYKQI